MSDAVLPDGLKKLSHYLDKLPGHRTNERRHPSALIRVVTKGSLLPDGRRLRLRAIRFGSSWLTTDAWFADYVNTLTEAHTQTPADGQAPDAGIVRSPTARRKAADAAVKALEELGA